MKALSTFIALLTATGAWSQYCDDHDSTVEAESLKSFFLQGKLYGHVRNSAMGTVNEGELMDYFANAWGGSIGYHTACFKGFEVGVKGIFTYNMYSTDLLEVDSLAGKSAKWEKELFDVTRPEEKHDLDRLEELYIKYHYKDSYLSYGKIDINEGPLLLRRDGRMKPFVYKGFWGEYNELHNQKLYFGWIYGVSPRGMTEWYSLNEAIGLNNNGYQPDGTKADYQGAANTPGLGVIGYKLDMKKAPLKLQVWNYHLTNMYNTLWTQLDCDREHTFGGIQYVFQNAAPKQRELAYEERVFQPDEFSNTISAQYGVQWKKKGTKLSFAYLHGFGGGRFQFPRELTREKFYVSQQRSWMDGYGEVNAYQLHFKYAPKDGKWKGLKLDGAIARVEPTDRTDYANNKYGVSPYLQATFIAKYEFQRKLEGLELMFLHVYKFSEPGLNLTPSETFYKTNLHHLNLIVNINF